MRIKILSVFLLIINFAFSLSYNFSRLDNSNGLSNNQIESIFKDSRGFMWFGTNFGLNRYDGYQVKIYKSDKNDSTSLIFNSIPEIQEDFEGNLWLKGNPEYVVYDIHTEKFIRNLTEILKPKGINFTPLLVEFDREKNYYFYNQYAGIFKYDIQTNKLKSFQQGIGANSLSKGNIIGLRTGNRCFWVLYQSGLLERYNEQTNSVDFRSNNVQLKSAGASISKNLFVDKEGCPWVFPGIGDKGVLYYDLKTSNWIYFGSNKNDFRQNSDKLITTDFVRDIAQEKNGNVWIATDHGGVNIYDKTTGRITVLLNDPMNPNSISQNSVISLFADNNGIMWVGTYKNGISYYHPGMFKFEKSPLFFYQNSKLENKDCNIIYEDSKSNLWLGTNGSGLLKYNKNTNSFKLYRNDKNNSNSISSDIIISSLEDKSGTMWFGTFMGGLNSLQGESFNRYLPDANNSNSLSNKSIYGLAEDENQQLWIGTLGGGVDKLDVNRKNFSHNNINNVQGLSSNFILSMYAKNQEFIYLCTSGGIDMINTKTGIISSVFKDKKLIDRLSDKIIINTLIDRRNQLWIATDNGLNVYNADLNTIKYINKNTGLPSEQVVSLVEDNEGNIWTGTRNGLACIYCKLNKTTKEFDYSVVSFDENDGLISSIFNQNAAFKGKDGRIYFGCTKGYTVFDPKNIHFNRFVATPKITGLLIGKEEINPGKKYNKEQILEESITHLKKLTLNYNQNNFSILFSAMSYIHPEKNQYRFMLKGLDKEWIVSKNGIVSYSNLNHGNYELIVYASNNDNVWSKEPLVLKIVINPPFWFSWWAIILYIIFTLYSIWHIVNFNLRKQMREFENEQRIREAKQLHEMDEMKFRFFTNISHEFRTPLTLIINPVEKLMTESTSEVQKNLLTIIHRNANGLLELVNQLLDFRKLDVQKDSLNLSVGDAVAFIKDICYSFTELANKKAINFMFSTSNTEIKMEFDPEKLRKIVSNLLSNAFKFTPDRGKIEVNLNLTQQLNDDKKWLKIAISDAGIGIPAKDLDRIFERFYRVENPENGHQTGTGVGLHIVSEYVKLHEGTIKVESEIGKGSVFSLLIPAKQDIQEEIISNTETISTVESSHEIAHNEHKSKFPLLLIVDDNEDFRNFIAAIFTEKFRIITAEDGEKALKQTLDKIPDLIISDVMMPKLDGFEFCKLVKQDIRISHIPIILLTAKTGDENKYIGLQSGAEDYISKPFKMEMLSLKVARIIERQKQQHKHFNNKIQINPTEIEITPMDEKFVKKAVEIIEKNIDNSDFLVEDLCREIGMSRVHFYKKILALTDKAPSELIRFIRLKRAADLLERSQQFVSEIAYQVGFNDPKYFRKCFKEEFGISPNDYKKKYESISKSEY